MFQQLRRFLSIDRIPDHPHPQPSNQVTPSQNRHINSLPTELLIMIFQGCCDYWFTSDPILLSLVCRFWHAIVTACPALWTTITFDPCTRYEYGYSSRGKAHPIFCRGWSNLERALRRAGTASLTLKSRINSEFYHYNNEERVLRLFGRCRDLRITYAYTFASPLTMPHLEHLTLDIGGSSHIEPLLDSIERRSPLFKSLSIIGSIPTNLARHMSLLRRIVRFRFSCVENDDIPFQGLQNLEELTICYYSHSKAIKFFSSEFPKLVSLHIWGDIPLPLNQLVTFPLLESLKLENKWTILQFIAAPKLRNINLTNRDTEEPEGVTMSALQRSTVHPMSLSIDFFPDAYLQKLLSLWSNLSELHLRDWGNACHPGPITTAALAGSRGAPLCSSLRYLTVHIEEGRKDSETVNQSIQGLISIVKKRKGYGVVGLQRVMCVWNPRYYSHDGRVSSEVEWIDIL